MRTRTRGIAATASGVILSVTALAGCGGNSDDPRADAAHPPTTAPATTTPAANPSTATAKAAPLTQAELWDAVVTDKDLPGFDVRYVQLKGSPYVPGIPPNRFPAVYPAACTPVYWSTQEASTYPVTARITAMAGQDSPEQFGSVDLTVYSTTDAPRVMADLHKALAACTGTRIGSHDELSSDTTYTHAESQPAPHLGDDAVSFHITQNIAADNVNPEPIATPMTFTIVRVGTTVATFWNQGDAIHTTPPVIAPQLIPAQVTKLTRSPHKPA